MTRKIALLVLVLACAACAVFVGAQSPPAKYKPSEIQLLKLQVKQRDAEIAQRDLQTAQQKFQQALLALTQESDQVKSENKWDAKVQFNPNDLTFSDPPKEQAKKQQ